MAVYLYNLGFSVTDAANGNFRTGGSGLNNSDAWFSYNQSGLPSGVTDDVVPLAALTGSQWSSYTGATSFNAGSDYLLLRIFNTDSFPAPAPTLKLRLTAVFGRGTSSVLPATVLLQAPFLSGSRARSVVDIDNGSNPPGWPTPTGTDGAWTYCIGMFHGVTNDYCASVGASVWVSSGSYSGYSYFGHEPQIHITGS